MTTTLVDFVIRAFLSKRDRSTLDTIIKDQCNILQDGINGLALRTAECNDRGPEDWIHLTAHRLHQRAHLRLESQQQRAAERQSTSRTTEPGVLTNTSKPPPAPVASLPADQSSSPQRSASIHPWRRSFLKRLPDQSPSPPLLAKK